MSLEQESGVQGSLLALDNSTGDVKAMVGGRDFEQSKFNRATQALRQVGSSFKPYIYTAAIDQGLTPDDTVLDAPISFNTPSGPYTPHNYDGKFEGVITFRHALAESRNIPALKVTERVGGIKTVIDYARKFGITSPLPRVLAGRAGRRRHHAGRANRGVHDLPQRWCARDAALHPQSDRLRWPRAGGKLSRSEGRRQRAHGAHHGDHVARGGAARNWLCRPAS